MACIASVTFFCLVGVFAAFVVCKSNGLTINNSIKNLVIDTDAGADDGMAILAAIAVQEAYPDEFKIIAITCTYGNTFVTNVENNIRKLLTTAKRHDIKIYSGASKPLVESFKPDYYFGQDGFGDFEFGKELTAEIDYSMHASVALVQLAKKYKGNLTVMTLGPLTNVALASTLDPEFMKNVNTFYMMGGSVHGQGNVSPGKEYNFFMDPLSNFIMFSRVQKSGGIVLLPWETIFGSQLTKEWRQKILGSYNSTYINFLNKAEGYMLEHNTSPTYTPSDSMIAMSMLWPDIVTHETLVNVQAVVTGEAKGSLLVDYANETQDVLNTRVIDAVQVDVFKKLLIQYLS